MTWVVDTCVLIDVLEDDPQFGLASAKCLANQWAAGLVVCPISYIELSPAFMGDETRQIDFLTKLGATFDEPWTEADTRMAHKTWNRYIDLKRNHHLPRRPIADVLICAFASRFQGLITRNRSDFSHLLPSLKFIDPTDGQS